MKPTLTIACLFYYSFRKPDLLFTYIQSHFNQLHFYLKKVYVLIFSIGACCTANAQSSFWGCGRDFLNHYPNTTFGVVYNEYYGKGSSGQNITGFKDVVYAEDNGEEDGDETLKGATCSARPYTCKKNDNDGTLPDIHYDGTLKYDVYYPIVSNLPTPSQSPAIFFFHPGGFSDCSYKDLPGIVHMCEEFALRGFVVFNVEYRRGIILDKPYTTVQQVMENYRAFQDARGAIRTAFRRQDEGWESNLYRIRKNQIFIAGMSAGGSIAMNLAYCTTNIQIAQIFPTTGTYTAEQILGPIDADFYYGDPTIPFQTSIKGVLDMWGGLPLPKNCWNNITNQTNFFSSNTYNPPLIAFAGINDDVFPVPINSNGQKVFFSPTYFSENRCLPNNPPYTPYIVNHQSATIYDATIGSTLNMYTILKALGVSTEMYIDCQAGHGLDKACNSNTNPGCYASNYGTGADNPTDVQTYFVQRACIFFQDNINSITNTGTTLFYECENTRGSCNGTYTGCSNATPCQPTN